MVEQTYSNAERNAVALKGYTRIARAWGLSSKETAALLDMTEDDLQRARNSAPNDSVTDAQLLRISAVLGIYVSLETFFSAPLAQSWISRPNTGPLFEGRRPINSAIEGGLPQLLRIRSYLDGLAGR